MTTSEIRNIIESMVKKRSLQEKEGGCSLAQDEYRWSDLRTRLWSQARGIQIFDDLCEAQCGAVHLEVT